MTNLNRPRICTERKLDRADFDHYATLDAAPDAAPLDDRIERKCGPIDATAVLGVVLMVTSAALVTALFWHLIALWRQA